MTDFTFGGNLQTTGLRFTAQPEYTWLGIGNGLDIDTDGTLKLSANSTISGWYLTQPEGDNEGRPGKALYTSYDEVDSVIISKPGSTNFFNGVNNFNDKVNFNGDVLIGQPSLNEGSQSYQLKIVGPNDSLGGAAIVIKNIKSGEA